MTSIRKKRFVDGIAVLHFHARGSSTMHEWSIGCDAANDNDETIKAHLARWRPECELDWVEIRPVKWATADDDAPGTTIEAAEG